MKWYFKSRAYTTEFTTEQELAKALYHFNSRAYTTEFVFAWGGLHGVLTFQFTVIHNRIPGGGAVNRIIEIISIHGHTQPNSTVCDYCETAYDISIHGHTQPNSLAITGSSNESDISIHGHTQPNSYRVMEHYTPIVNFNSRSYTTEFTDPAHHREIIPHFNSRSYTTEFRNSAQLTTTPIVYYSQSHQHFT